MSTVPSLDSKFAALADPTRRAILSRLMVGEATVGELTTPFSISQPAVSRHLKVLENAGLIVRRVDGSRRHCRLRQDGLDEITDYLNEFRARVGQNYMRLDRLLADGRKQRK